MPSTSAKQAKFMRAVANNPKFAKKAGVSQSVGKDFEMADKKKGKKFGTGGTAKKPLMESERKPIDMRRAILGSDKDIVDRANRTPREKMPKTGPKDMPYRRPKLKKAGEMGYAKGGKVKKFNLGGPAAPSATPLKDASPKTSGLPGTGGVQMAAKPAMAAPAPSATPLKDASPRTSGLPGTGGVQLAAGKPPVSTVSTASPNRGLSFDRNAAYKAFNARAADLYKQGVPMKAITRQQAIMRKLQMDNSSTPEQHRQAFEAALAALKPGMKAGGKVMKSSDKAGRALVKKSADTKGRAMKYAAGGLAAGHKAANGIAKKGKTKGTQVKMNKGGACYAKGGSVRGIDGIAMKGKTRCKGAK